MKYLKYIFFLLLIAIIGVAVYVAVQPNSFEVERSRTINAPAAVIYNNVIDFKNWETWSSWKEEKPETKITLPEKTNGVGGYYSWEDEDGIGTMTTTAAKLNASIIQEMQFADFPKSDVNWNFEPNKDGTTNVTWTIKGNDLPFDFKIFSALMGGMETQIGPHFERGLELLDSVIQKDMKRYAIEVNGITEYGGGFYIYKTTNANSNNISLKMAQNYGELMQFMSQNNIKQSGMPLTVYNDMTSSNVIMSNGIPVKERVEIPLESDVSINFMPRIRVLKTTLLGNYTNLPKAWEAITKHIADNNLKQSDEYKPFEIYTTDPSNYPNPADWKTEIYMPLQE